MRRMVSFRLNRDCREVTINPAKVLYVCPYEHGASSIHFGKDCQLRVQGDLADVVARIEAAMCEDTHAAPTAPLGPAGRLRPPDVN